MRWITIFLLLLATTAGAADVTLTWDHNDPLPEGYRIFCREEGYSYNYDIPIWQGPENIATVTVDDGTTWYFVVRAYEGDLESVDSEEVFWPPDPGPVTVPPITQGFTVSWIELHTKVLWIGGSPVYININ